MPERFERALRCERRGLSELHRHADRSLRFRSLRVRRERGVCSRARVRRWQLRVQRGVVRRRVLRRQRVQTQLRGELRFRRQRLHHVFRNDRRPLHRRQVRVWQRRGVRDGVCLFCRPMYVQCNLVPQRLL